MSKQQNHEREVQGLGMTLSSRPRMTSVLQRSTEHQYICPVLQKLLSGIIYYWRHEAPGIFLTLDNIN